jgi:predicted RNase H-like nuclease (RuvC/YqgF family)
MNKKEYKKFEKTIEKLDKSIEALNESIDELDNTLWVINHSGVDIPTGTVVTLDDNSIKKIISEFIKIGVL